MLLLDGWMDGWCVGRLLEKCVENFLQCEWSTRIILVIGLSLVKISFADAELAPVY
jgi:hypothetical protein